MIAIGNNETCPLCDEIKKPSSSDEIMEHLQKKHPKEFEEALFGNRDIGC